MQLRCLYLPLCHSHALLDIVRGHDDGCGELWQLRQRLQRRPALYFELVFRISKLDPFQSVGDDAWRPSSDDSYGDADELRGLVAVERDQLYHDFGDGAPGKKGSLCCCFYWREGKKKGVGSTTRKERGRGLDE